MIEVGETEELRGAIDPDNRTFKTPVANAAFGIITDSAANRFIMLRQIR